GLARSVAESGDHRVSVLGPRGVVDVSGVPTRFCAAAASNVEKISRLAPQPMNRTLSPPRYSFWQLSAIRHDRLRVERRAHVELSRQPYKLTSSTGPELPANRRNARSNGPCAGFALAYRSRVRPLNTCAVRRDCTTTAPQCGTTFIWRMY